MKNTPANDNQEKLKEALRAYHVALTLDIDAFLWIHSELERIWKALIIFVSKDPDNAYYWQMQNLLAELDFIVGESGEFASQSQNDLKEIEKEAGKDEQDTVNSGDG